MVTNTAKKQANSPAKAEAKKPGRKMLTPAERVAKLEADLKAAREAAAAKDAKKIDALKEKRGVLVQKVNEAQAKVRAIDEELQLLGYEIEAPVVGGTPVRPALLADDESQAS